MRRLTFSSALALTVLFIGQGTEPLQAQQDSLAGLWACEQANYTIRNMAADNYTISWIMELRSDGTLEAQGSFFGAVTGFAEAMSGQGRWRATQLGMELDFQWNMSGRQMPGKYDLRAAGPQMIKNGRLPGGQYSVSCQRTQG